MMNRYHNESVDLANWSTGHELVVHRQEITIQTLSVAPAFSADLPGVKNIFQAKVGNENGLVPLTALELQILAAGIVLDQELIAECRSGEI